MGTFNKLKKISKTSPLDEKIEFLNKELKKTGVVCESAPANSTAGIYNIIAHNPGLPQLTSAVPDSTGFADGGTQNANGGDEGDPSTWDDGWNNITDMKNPNDLNGKTNRNIPITADLTSWDGTGANHSALGDYGGIAVFTVTQGIGGGLAVGTLDGDGTFVPILQPNNIDGYYTIPNSQTRYSGWSNYSSYSDGEFAAAVNMHNAYEANKNKGSVTRKVYVPFAMRQGSSDPGYNDYTGVKKQTLPAGSSVYKDWKLITVNVLTGANDYISQNFVPSSNTVLSRNNLGDPTYFPGLIKKYQGLSSYDMFGVPEQWGWMLKNAFGLSSEGLAFLKNMIGMGTDELRRWIGDYDIKDVVDDLMFGLEDKWEKLDDLSKKFIKDAKDDDKGFFKSAIENIVLPYVESKVNKDEKDPFITPGWYNFINYLNDDLPARLDNNYLEKLKPGMVKQIWKQSFIQANDSGDQVLHAQENIIGSSQIPRRVGNYIEADYTMNFKTNIEDFAEKASKGEGVAIWKQAFYNLLGKYSSDAQTNVVTGLDMIAGFVFGKAIEKAKAEGGAKSKPGTIRISLEELAGLNRQMIKDLNRDGLITDAESIKLIGEKHAYRPPGYWGESKIIKEGWESPKHTYIDKDQQKRWFKIKDVAPIYPKKAPPKMIGGYHPDMLPKLDTPIPQLKVKKKDLIKAHLLKDEEAQKLMDIVDSLNDYIARNPDMLAYARERYPVSDPHLAALNYKMDMQIAAADEYLEKQFPENTRLYNKVMSATKRSIKLTDPKTFKSEKGVFTTFNKLARVQHIDNVYQPKERKLKLKKRGKNSVNRFLFKPKEKTKDDILKDKMAVLDKEMKKTMPDT